MARQEDNISAVRVEGRSRAVIFIHGFSGARDDTWDRFPGFVGAATPDWDIFTIGYATTLLPDIVGVWSADPDLPILAKMLRTQLALPPFKAYKSLALIAHSMGGLIVQEALVDDPTLADRVAQVILFGTPSGGIRKASWLQFWKRQLKNMAVGGQFITQLRSAWQRRFGQNRPFNLLVVAGASDQFVPPASSLSPFEDGCQHVVVGDHVAIVKPSQADAPSVMLVVETLKSGRAPGLDTDEKLRLAAETANPKAPTLVEALENRAASPSAKSIVDAALALDRIGKRSESIALLDRHKDLDTDVKGSLAGRYKRIWFESGSADEAQRALTLYQEALAAAKAPDQIYYLAINVAFMQFVFLNDVPAARSYATRALDHADPPGDDLWKTATVAEANLYLGNRDAALAGYKRLVALQGERWKHQSAALQATRLALKLGDTDLANQLELIFTPEARRVNKIFVSYSHKDKKWLERLKIMIAPYLRNAETELDFWEDTRLKAGDSWNEEITEALQRAGVGVALVSANFLGSSYVADLELPAMLKAAKDGDLRLLWVYLSSAGWEETALKDFQAAHDTATPLDSRPEPEQNEVLKSVAQQIKAAGLAATDRFKKLKS